MAHTHITHLNIAADWNRPPQGKATPNTTTPLQDNGPCQVTNTIEEWLEENEKEPLTWPVNSLDPTAIESNLDRTKRNSSSVIVCLPCPCSDGSVLEAREGQNQTLSVFTVVGDMMLFHTRHREKASVKQWQCAKLVHPGALIVRERAVVPREVRKHVEK